MLTLRPQISEMGAQMMGPQTKPILEQSVNRPQYQREE